MTKRVGVAVTHMALIREVLGSNLGWDVDYPDCSFRLFSSVREVK
jgi:hypothetical protein